MNIHPDHRPAMRQTVLLIFLMLTGMAAAWLLPVIPEARGIAAYLPLHTLLETISIVIAALVFAVSWNAYSDKLPGNIVLLGCAFLGVALLDFSHMLSFAGMPEFVTLSSPEKAINFWLVARSLAVVALFAVAVLPWRPFASAATRHVLLAVVLALTLATHWLLLFHPDALPRTFVQGEGLTAFKVDFEYAIIIASLAAAAVLWRRMHAPLPFNAPALFGAMCAMALSEYLFTLYAEVTDIYNLLGHVYKAIAYLFIYRAIFVTTVESPYRQLSASQGKLQATLDALPDLLFELDSNGRFHDIHTPHADLLAAPAEALLGRTVDETLPAEAADVVMLALCEAQYTGWSRGQQFALPLPQGETWFELSVTRKAAEPGQSSRYIVLSRDITERKTAEHEVQRLSRLYSALSQCNEAIVRSGSMAELLPVLCRDVVEFGGMKMAWIGILDPQSGPLKPVSSYGEGVEMLQESNASLKAGEFSPHGPASIAISQDQPYWCQNFQFDPNTAAWHEQGARLGWGASAALPLHRNGKVIGAFNLYAGETNAFDERARKLLVEMAMDIDFALHNFERETQRMKAVDELAESRNLLKTIIDTAPLRIFWKDRDLRYLGCNPVFAKDAGVKSPEEMIGKDDFQLGWKEQAEQYRADDRQVIESGIPKPFFDEPQTTPDGKHIWLSTAKVPLRDAAGNTTGVLGIYKDITERKRAEIALKHSEAELNFAQAIAQVGSWNYDLVSGRIEGSAESYRMFGITRPGATDLDTMLAIIHPDDRERMFKTLQEAVADDSPESEFRIVVDGETRWISARIKVENNADGKPVTVLGTTQDITAHKISEERIYYLAHFDALTGLPNRAQLDDRLKYAIRMAKRGNEHIALLFIDLDRFKDVNDTLGHSVGDAVLIQLAARLAKALREEDVVSRLGGDEFIVMLPDTDVRGVTLVVQKLLDVIAQPYKVEQFDLSLTASVGIALFPEDGEHLEALSRSADTAMYRAKQEGRNCYRFFTPEMQASSARNLKLVNDLRHALERGQLHVVYQPQMSIPDERVIGAEALLRWQHPEFGAVTPTEFIPVAEDSGLIQSIGEWVMRQAVQQLKAWMEAGIEPMIMAVNLSAVQFRHPNLPDMVTRILEEEGLPPEYLELELTEGVAMYDPQGVIAVMNNLHECGIRMSIDDFGTGYSSLSYLKKFKVYKLKIDQSFVRDISTDPEDKAIVCTVINIAKTLGLKTIAEGVETAGQLAFLREQGCDEVQGYFYSKPLSAEQFEAFVRARTIAGK
ncbi:MAG: EAL domain-containing protein [Sideroxyarcus sp.]|nr:EAL domain-containing protein [Sideroxyarcus sp.]